MDKETIIQQLTEFNRFASELFTLSFNQKLEGSGVTITYEKGKGVKTEFRGPDDEAIKAYVNDIRRFFQKGDDALRMYKLIPIYQSGFVEQFDKDAFNNVVSEYEKYNNSPLEMNIKINDKLVTHKECFDVFLYGRYSHRSKVMKEIHDKWEKIEPLYAIMKNEFICTLNKYLFFIDNITCTNNQVLEKMGVQNE